MPKVLLSGTELILNSAERKTLHQAKLKAFADEK